MKNFRTIQLVLAISATGLLCGSSVMAQSQQAGYGAGSSGPPAGASGGQDADMANGYGGGSSGPPGGSRGGVQLGGQSGGYGAGSSGPPAGGSGLSLGGRGAEMESGYGGGSSGPPGGGSGLQLSGRGGGLSGGGFGAGSSGPPGGPRGGARGGGSPQDMFASSFGAFSSLLGPVAMSGGPAEPVATGPILENEARTAYASGDYALAMNLLYGHIVAEYNDAQNVIRMAKFSRLMKRPAWQLRWGLSYTVRGDATDPQPIQEGSSSGGGGFGAGGFGGGDFGGGGFEGMEEQMEAFGGGSGGPGGGSRGGGSRGGGSRGGGSRGGGSRGGSGGGGGGFGASGFNASGFGAGQFEEEMAGMAEEMAMEMAEMEMAGGGGPGGSRGGSGGFGGGGSRGGSGGGFGSLGGGFGFGGPAAGGSASESAAESPFARLAGMERSMLSAEAAEEVESVLGLVVTILGEEYESRFNQGDFGRALTDVSPDSPEGPISSEFVDALQSSPESLPMWRQSFLYLGDGELSKNVKVAQANTLDLVVHFDVLLKETRGDFVQNICRCRLIHVPSGKSLGVSRPIDSLELAQKSRARGMDSREYVTEQLSNLIGIIDRQAKTMDMPQLTPEIARKRIGSLLSSGGGNSLRTLAEVRLYQSQKLLSEEEVMTAFDIVGGPEAMRLLFGSEEEKLEIVRNWSIGKSTEL